MPWPHMNYHCYRYCYCHYYYYQFIFVAVGELPNKEYIVKSPKGQKKNRAEITFIMILSASAEKEALCRLLIGRWQ